MQYWPYRMDLNQGASDWEGCLGTSDGGHLTGVNYLLSTWRNGRD